MTALDDAQRALELSERLRARGRADLADRLLGRAIETVGGELARRDGVVRSMLDLDAELAAARCDAGVLAADTHRRAARRAATFAPSAAVPVPAKSVNPKGAR